MTAVFLCPILGFIVDKVGKRALFLVYSSIFLIFACVLTEMLPSAENGITNYSVFIPLILLGLGNTIVSIACWASIPYTCEKKVEGTAFGVCTSIQSIGLVIAPLIAA